jgi:endonuclease/exonuclease/phosphatase family metal-dependent hydrolase
MERTMKKLLLPLMAIGLLVGCDEDPISSGPDDTPTETEGPAVQAVELTVMTRNMYIGADVDKVIEASDPTQIMFLVEEAWQTMLATDYPARAAEIAREIADANPHLVGLQEVYTIRTQSPADFEVNAAEVAFDFLATLNEQLEALGTDYRVVGQVENSDVEMPRFNRTEGLVDVRVTDYDVVLARGDVEVSNVVAANYEASFPVQGLFEIKRGYIMLDATVDSLTFRFVNTHPEPSSTADGYFQDLQVKELIEVLDAESKPTILLGDMNTQAPMSPIYGYFIEHGYQDVWTLLGDRNSDGMTCCHLTTLDNASVDFYERIDLIFVHGVEGLLPEDEGLSGSIEIVGEELGDRTDAGLWPSDHAGLVATLNFVRAVD